MSICDDDLEGSIKEILKMLILWVSTSHILAVLHGYSIQVLPDFVSNGPPF